MTNEISYSNNSYWRQFQVLSGDIPGWSPPEELLALFTLALSTSKLDGDFLEIGSWCGRSAIALAMAGKLMGVSGIYCIDLFPEKTDWFCNEDGTYSFSVNIDETKYDAFREQTIWEAPYKNDILPVYDKYNGILDAFKHTISKYQFESLVKPFKGDLRLFLSTVHKDFKLRMAFIDGDHGYGAVSNDIKLVDKYLVSGGWICFDDAYTSYDGVNNAILDHITNNPKYDTGLQLTRKLFVARKY